MIFDAVLKGINLLDHVLLIPLLAQRREKIVQFERKQETVDTFVKLESFFLEINLRHTKSNQHTTTTALTYGILDLC
jgi:hypothetical protein